MAGAIAYNLKTAFIPLRKPDKLPADTYSVSYTMEYGTTEMHIHQDALDGHTNLLIIDDLLATGGTMIATANLLRRLGGVVEHAGFVISLPELGGEQKLIDCGVTSFSICEFEGE